MDMFLFLTINLILQSCVDCYVLKNTLKEEKKLTENKILILFFIFFLTNTLLITEIRNIPNVIILIHIINLIILGFIYKKSLKKFLIVYSVFYYFHLLYSIIFANIINIYVRIEITFKVLFLSVIVLGLFSILAIRFKVNYSKINKNWKYSTTLIITSLLIDFPIMFYMNLVYDEPKVIIYSTIISFIVFLSVIIIYFYKIYTESGIINTLNKELELKNTELKDIKNTQANIIFYLEQLYSSGNKEEGGVLLKKIINKEVNECEVIKSNANNNSLIQTALNRAISKGIEVEIHEKCDIFCADMNGIELYRIIVNIINNAIKALKGKGKIKVETYCSNEDKFILKIGNNGPKIDKDIIGKIFEAGFTTKNNKEKNHGYGLNIVKELIENNKGEITVNSTVEWTEFKIVLPKKYMG